MIINLILSGFSIFCSEQFGARDVAMSVDQITFLNSIFLQELGKLNYSIKTQENIKAIFIMR